MLIKDALSKMNLARGRDRSWIYSLDGKVRSVKSIVHTNKTLVSVSLIVASVFSTIRPYIWHNKLAHPFKEVFNNLYIIIF